MSKEITRSALYDLVWSKPRTELARHFGISDVAVGKLCQQMNVPAPPRGYWAHLAAGGHGKSKFVRPELAYTVLERIDEDHARLEKQLPPFDPKNFDQPLPPAPQCDETLEAALARYRVMVAAVPLPKPDRGQHPIVRWRSASSGPVTRLGVPVLDGRARARRTLVE